MIDMVTRLKVHLLSEGGIPQETIAESCEIGLRSVERILAEETPPTRDEIASGQREGGKRRGRPSKASDEVRACIVALLNLEPDIPAIEVLRRSKDWGYTGGRSQLSALVKSLRPSQKTEPVVRFEGLPGEYTQFDFGTCRIRLADGTTVEVDFFAARLKYSRYMYVQLVPNQTAEVLMRGILAAVAAFGGSTKEWVFDNPRTVRVSPIGVKPVVLHRYLRQLVAEYRVIPTLCAPRSGNQKGSVERLVGYVKNSFLRVRTFRDAEDVNVQLKEWLREVNEERPSDATGIIPSVALERETPWLLERPLQTQPENWPIIETATVTPMGTLTYRGASYSATARYLGSTATLHVREASLEIHVGTERCSHVRQDGKGEVHWLPAHRGAVLAALHGPRKGPTFRRQCLLELGQCARDFLEPLVHRCPEGRWEAPCHELYELMCAHGEGAMQDAMTRCVSRKTFTVAAIRVVLKEVA